MNKTLFFSKIGLVLLAGTALLAANPVAASQITVYPGTHTPDTADALGMPGNSAPGFSAGSFQANGSAKSAVYLGADELFGSGSSVTVGDLLSFSYWTYQEVPSTVNWYVEIYTVSDGTDDDSWYGRRLNFEPYFSENYSEPDNQWVQWSTDGVGPGNTNKLQVFDANRGESGSVYGTYTDPFLSDLTSGPINWDDYYSGYESGLFDYRNEEILRIGISTGSGWAGQFTGLVDGFSINWDSGSGAQNTKVNFEARALAVPAPSMFVLFLSALAMLGLLSLRRKHLLAGN